MPKDFLQGASLTPTFEALMVKFGGKIGTLYQMLKNAFKKHPLQNRTNVQIKGGGGVKGLLNSVQKNCTFLKWGHPLPRQWRIDPNFKFAIFEGSISQCVIRAKIVSKSFMQQVDGCIAADFFFERQPLNQQNQLAPSTLKDLHLSLTVFYSHSI